MSKIIIKCVKEKSKLRIRFHSYFDNEGKEYRGAYNNTYNCQFPKDIRVEGRFYEIGENDLNTVITRGKPFYRVSKNNIKILENYIDPEFDVNNLKKIYSLEECVVCMTFKPNVIFIPCGHQCTCEQCYNVISKEHTSCSLCKKNIANTFITQVNELTV